MGEARAVESTQRVCVQLVTIVAPELSKRPALLVYC